MSANRAHSNKPELPNVQFHPGVADVNIRLSVSVPFESCKWPVMITVC